MGVEFTMSVEGLKECSQALQNLYDAVERDEVKFLKGVGLIVERDAKRKCPVGDTGQLRGSIRTANPERLIGGAQVKVVANKSYAQYVEIGTGIFGPKKKRIFPKTAKALSWIGPGGKRITVKSIKGMKAQPFMYPALESNFRNITKAVAKGVDEAVKKGIKK